MSEHNNLVNKLNLKAHPEGGYYKEVFRSSESISKAALPERFSGARNYITSIYFLLEKDYFSAFHRIQSDELWYFHRGADLNIHVIMEDGTYKCYELGAERDLQCCIPALSWFAAETKGNYSLVSCAVAPGFDFSDFELAEKSKLSIIYPQHQQLIDQFCRK
ncbi:MAG: cupin domain-containing protein [Chitinophagales bacterium]